MTNSERERVGNALTDVLTYVLKTPNGNEFIRRFEFVYRDVLQEILNQQSEQRTIGFAPNTKGKHEQHFR